MRSVLVAAGDGIGPEVIEATLYAMDGLGLDLELYLEPVGLAGMDQRGETLSDDTLAIARDVDAILLGAVMTPPGGAHPSALLTLRRELDLYANVRPARPLAPWLSPLGHPPAGGPPGTVDLVVVRENTEGLYSGREREEGDGAVAERVVTAHASTRLHRFAFAWAREHGRNSVTCVHKANVLRLTDGLFLGTFREVAASEAGDLEVADIHLDAAAAAMVSHPASLDVLVTPNLYGDVLSDLAAALSGGIGLAPSGSFGEGHALFEPVHGAAPDIAGQGVADPIGAMLSAAMMLEHLGHGEEASRFVTAVRGAVLEGVGTPDIGGDATTLGFAQAVRDNLEAEEEG